MKRIAITGVSGYIGSRLLYHLSLLDDVEKVIGIDIKPPPYNPPKLRFYRHNILQPPSEIFLENGVDSAVHLVFVLKPTHNKRWARKINIGGTLSFLKACKEAGVQHIIYLSSHTVYGAHPQNKLPLKEDEPLCPLKDFQYSWEKAEAEKMLSDFASSHKIKLTILRSCLVIGPHAKNSIVASMLKPIMIRVSGYDPPIQFVHEDDLVRLIATIILKEKAGVFNVAGDGEIRYSEIARILGRRMIALPDWFLRSLMGLSWALRLQKESPPSGLEFIKYPPLLDTEKLKREVGFNFAYSSRDALLSFQAKRLSIPQK